MTKNEAKKWIREILEKVAELRETADDLNNEAEYTYDEIEPYEGRDELTPAQEERQEWFRELTDKLSDAVSSLETIESDLEEMDY